MSRPAKTWFQSSTQKKESQGDHYIFFRRESANCLTFEHAYQFTERANEQYEKDMGLPSKKRKRQEEEEEKKAKIKRGKFDGMSRKKRRLLMTMEDTQDTQAQTERGIKRLKVSEDLTY